MELARTNLRFLEKLVLQNTEYLVNWRLFPVTFVLVKKTLFEISPASNGHALEFLVVCNDSLLFSTVTEAIRAVRGRLNCAPSLVSARDYIARRKIDGIVIDMALP